MSNKSPIFPTTEPQHFSDYGFDPQIDYFQVLEDARRHKRETSSISSSKDAYSSSSSSKKKIKRNKKGWWKKALLFFRWKWTPHHGNTNSDNCNGLEYEVHGRRAIRGSISGPVYLTESRSGSSTPYRTTTRPSSGPLTPTEKDEVLIPYVSLREINMDRQHQHRVSTSAMPIYLVT